MLVHNRDLFPDDSLVEIYSAIKPILVNPIVDDRFRGHEIAASRAKRIYHRRGRVASMLVMFGALFTVADALVIPKGGDPAQLGVASSLLAGVSLLAILMAISGLVLQVHLIMTKMKTSWLINRFAAERLRSIKFQAYGLVGQVQTTQALQTLADAFYTRETSRLDAELNAREAALALFRPRTALAPTGVAGTNTGSPLLPEAQNAYRDLRISYQKRFATDEIQALRAEQRIGFTTADLLYLLGAALAVAALSCKIFYAEAETIAHWIDFGAVCSFVVGLTKSLTENASLGQSSLVRYEDYVDALDDCERELLGSIASFEETVKRFERVVLDELAQFSQAAAQISYRM